jgi:Ca2+-binding EF-hand superfamily protein
LLINQELDADDSGFLSANEIMAVLKKSNVPNPKEEVARMFTKARKKKTDELSYDEFVSLMIYGTVLFPTNVAAKKGLTPEKIEDLKVAFKHFDKDNSGKISFEEFKVLISKVGKSPLSFISISLAIVDNHKHPLMNHHKIK